MKLETDFKGMVILLLIIGLVLSGVYKYRDFRTEQLQLKVANTQQFISQLNIDGQIAGAFKSLGYAVKDYIRPASTIPLINLPDSTNTEEE